MHNQSKKKINVSWLLISLKIVTHLAKIDFIKNKINLINLQNTMREVYVYRSFCKKQIIVKEQPLEKRKYNYVEPICYNKKWKWQVCWQNMAKFLSNKKFHFIIDIISKMIKNHNWRIKQHCFIGSMQCNVTDQKM